MMAEFIYTLTFILVVEFLEEDLVVEFGVITASHTQISIKTAWTLERSDARRAETTFKQNFFPWTKVKIAMPSRIVLFITFVRPPP